MAPDASWMNSFLADRAARRARSGGRDVPIPPQAVNQPAAAPPANAPVASAAAPGIAPPAPAIHRSPLNTARPAPGSASASVAPRAQTLRHNSSRYTQRSLYRPRPWTESWRLALSRPSVTTFERLAGQREAGLGRAYLWMTVAAGLAWALPAAAGVWRGGVPAWALAIAYWVLVLLTVAVFAVATGAAHWLARQLGASGSYERLAFACAAYAAPLTVVTGAILAGPAGLRLALLPIAGYGLALTVLAVRAAYQLEWRWALVAALPAATLLAGVPLAAVAGVWAGLA